MEMWILATRVFRPPPPLPPPERKARMRRVRRCTRVTPAYPSGAPCAHTYARNQSGPPLPHVAPPPPPLRGAADAPSRPPFGPRNAKRPLARDAGPRTLNEASSWAPQLFGSAPAGGHSAASAGNGFAGADVVYWDYTRGEVADGRRIKCRPTSFPTLLRRRFRWFFWEQTELI